jgi:hypothetical protein
LLNPIHLYIFFFVGLKRLQLQNPRFSSENNGYDEQIDENGNVQELDDSN